MIFTDLGLVVKVYARLYKMKPGEVMGLTLPEIDALLPDDVEKALDQAEGAALAQVQQIRAVESLKRRFPGRESFSEEEVAGETWRMYGRAGK